MLEALTSSLRHHAATLTQQVAGAVGGAPTPAAGIVGPPGSSPVLVRLLALNDFHGQLGDSDAKLGAMEVGGAATMAGYINRERAANPNGTVVLSAGDAIGASPPESTLLDHESTFATLAGMGMDVATVGNHEFDRGYAETMRLIKGGRRTKRVRGKNVAGPMWPGSPFPFVSANIVDRKSGKPVLPPYIIKTVNGVKVAFIGATTKNLKKVTLASGIKNVTALDPAKAINRYIPEIKAQGVRAVVVLIHEGGEMDEKSKQLSGDIVDVVKRMDPEVDAVVSAHSHKEYVARVNGKLVTQALSYAKALAEIDLLVDRKSGDVVASNARIIKNDQAGVAPDPLVDHMVKAFKAKVAPVAERVISILPGPVTREMSTAGETAMGTLIAEAQRVYANADIAFMNPGGIRQDLTVGGPVTWGKLFGVQPFANRVTRMQMSGAQILKVLEQMFPADGKTHPTILQVAGMRVWFDMSKPAGSRITKVVTDDGKALDPKRSYTVAANAFLCGGGDGFTELMTGANKQEIGTDLDALVKYLKAGNPVPLAPVGRLNIAGGALPKDAH